MPVSQQGPLKSGDMLGQLEVTEAMSLGHSNAIYKARHKLTGRDLVIKILLPQFISDSHEVQRSMQAARAMASISHANVLAIHDFGMSPQGLPYTVTEPISGGSMQSLLEEEGHFSAPRLRRLFGQVCLGMIAVHEKNIVHRDLKPANFLISKGQDEKVTIIDFAVCKRMEPGRDSLTLLGEIIGTPYYMSPEQCLGEPADYRSDIYAVGCCMFEAMTGAKPFAGATMVDTMSKQVSALPIIPEDLDPEFKGLTSVILKCLEKEPGDRYQSMSQLHNALTGQPVKTKPAKNLRNLDD